MASTESAKRKNYRWGVEVHSTAHAKQKRDGLYDGYLPFGLQDGARYPTVRGNIIATVKHPTDRRFDRPPPPNFNVGVNDGGITQRS